MWITILLIIIIVTVLFYRNKKSSFTGIQKIIIENIYSRKSFTIEPGKKLDGIDMVYVISMPSRLDYIKTQINNMRLECTYLNAVTPDDLSTSEINGLSNINNVVSQIYNKKTRLAVMLSFTLCYLDAIKKGYSTIIVFEDDIIPKIDLATLNNATLEFSRSDLDFFYMGYCFMNCNQPLDKNKYQYLIPLVDPSILCGHATAIKTKVLPGIIEYSFPMTIPSDETYLEYFVKNKSKLCIPKVPYFDQVTRDKMASLNESVVKLEYCR